MNYFLKLQTVQTIIQGSYRFRNSKLQGFPGPFYRFFQGVEAHNENKVHNELFKAPCKRTQQVGATSPNIVGIVLADVGFRVFKRSQHVGQCCFHGNTLGSLGLTFTQNSLLNCNVVTFAPPPPHYGAR